MSLQGTTDEDRTDLTKEESKAMRRRSTRLLVRVVKPLMPRVVFNLGMVLLSALAAVAGPAIMAYGIDTALPALAQRGDWTQTWIATGLYLIAAIASAATVYIYVVQTARISQDVLYDLRRRLFDHTQRLSLEFHETYTSGRIIARQTSDLESIRELLDSGLNELIRGIIMMVFTAVAMILLDPISGLIIGVALIPLYFLTRWFQKQSTVTYREMSVTRARMIVFFVETMTGIRAVKAFRKEARNEAEFGGHVESYRKAGLRAINVFGIFDPGLKLIGHLLLSAVVIVGAFRVLGGDLEVGALLASALYARQLFQPAEGVAMFYNSYQSASAALEKISGVLDEQPSVPEPAAPTPLPSSAGRLDFDEVEFAYADGKVILPEFDLHIPAGQTIALVGTTGAGKSTLAKLISRFYDPSSGTLSLDGISLRDLSNTDLRRAVVMVTQEAYLFSGTVADNIELGRPDASRDEIEAAAKAVGAHEFIMALPDGYDTDVNKRGGRVSAGQRQLLSFARAFLADPAVLILDEATASLDIPSERLVQEALTTLLDDRTAIIIAHRLSTVAIADRVLVMEHGLVIEDGTPDELVAAGGKFASLHRAWQESLV